MQILRGIAAMLVVFNHVGLFLVLWPDSAGSGSWFAPNEWVARMGAIGVDLFFVISGFVMALSARRFSGAIGAGTFVLLRFVRIAPLFYLACLGMLVVLTSPGTTLEREAVLNSVTFIPFFDDHTYSWPIHYLGWTLAFEFVFYTFVAAMVAAGIGARPFALLALVALVPLLGFFFSPTDLVLWRVVTNPILWEFALGVLAYIIWQRGWLTRAAVPLMFASLAAVAVLAVLFWLSPREVADLGGGTIEGSGSTWRALLWGVPAFLCFCAVVARGNPRAGTITHILKELGDASYSIYLSHLGVVLLLQKVIERVALPGDAVVIGTLVLSALVGVAVYRAIEAPMLRVGQQFVRDLVRNRLATATTQRSVPVHGADRRGSLPPQSQRH